MSNAINLVYFGSGSFGLPTLERLMDRSDAYSVCAVVTQPDRPAGRGRKLTPTPIAEWVEREHPQVPVLKVRNANEDDVIQLIHSYAPEAFLVIAFGQKLRQSLLDDVFAINLHGSLLPKYRGAAPINHAMMNNERITGVTVITLADRMDAGMMLAKTSTEIRPDETAGELHDRLARLGPRAVETVLMQHRRRSLAPVEQDESQATQAPKLTRADGTVSFDQPCENVRARIHGLNPWPGCAVTIGTDGPTIKIGRVHDHAEHPQSAAPGTVLSDQMVACASGAIEILEIQPPGKRLMSFGDYLNAHELAPGSKMRPVGSSHTA